MKLTENGIGSHQTYQQAQISIQSELNTCASSTYHSREVTFHIANVHEKSSEIGNSQHQSSLNAQVNSSEPQRYLKINFQPIYILRAATYT